MIVYPAIDIRGGRCVRLVEGDFDRETVFDDDPADAAARWEVAGASWIHVVDLDGAKHGRPKNIDAIRAVRDRVAAKIQLGGGFRTAADVEAALAAGIDRVVVGSAAVSNRDLVRDLVTRHGDRIAVGLDARDGMLATDGWLHQSDVSALELAQQLTEIDVATVIFTDIRRDGTSPARNLDALREMTALTSMEVIASGGVGDIGDVEEIRRTGAAGVIIGRALYDGRVDLLTAIATAGAPA